jgi:hypothetical protein
MMPCMTEQPPGYDPDNDEYTAAGATAALNCSRSTLDRWIPVGTVGRRLTEPLPGQPSEVRISGAVVRHLMPLPAGEGARRAD